jgi:hypothetical protein
MIDSIFVSVALIIQVSGTNLVGSATGFFFQVETNHYLVSNRHVFTGETLPPGVPRPDRFILPLHSNPSNITEAVFVTLAITGTNGNALWHEHPLGEQVDVAMLPLGENDVKGAIVHWLSKNDFPPESFSATAGQDLFVMGFPQGFHDRLFHLPIMRSALVSSVYGVPFEGKPFFFVDAKLHPGTSGSPVFTKPSHELPDGGFSVGGKGRIYLVGINSGELKPLPGQKDALALHCVWYPSILTNMHPHASGGKISSGAQPRAEPIAEILEKHGYSKRFFPDN